MVAETPYDSLRAHHWRGPEAEYARIGVTRCVATQRRFRMSTEAAGPIPVVVFSDYV